MTNLPAHLQAVIDKREKLAKELGLDTEWHIKALKKAEENNDDDAIIHALLR